MSFLTAIHTDIGLRKKTNQDSALILEAQTDVGNVLLAVICDGMGGLAKGEVASAAVIQAMSQWFETELPSILAQEDPREEIFGSWKRIVDNSNEKIASYGRQYGVSMGTTLVAVLFVRNKYYIINVGDSRAYCISDKVYQLTKDQSFVQREMDMGRMTPEEAKRSPQRNVLLQCVGASPYVAPDYFEGEFTPGMVFMLCSDGFRHLISEAELFDSLNPYVLTDERALHDREVYLVELNKNRGEMDNITVALVKTL